MESMSMSKADIQTGATVDFQAVGRSFGKLDVLKDFSLAIAAGEFLTLLGPSGSGKTTALNMIAGFLQPTSGDILIDGKSIASLPPEQRNVGMVFQNYSLFPHMSVFDNVAFPLKMRRASTSLIKEKVEKALELVHLADYAARMPNQLSGGQRQRVAFARAVVFAPRVLLMDEPLGALDLKLREHMQLEIKRYRDEIGCTMIYVTHDQGEALTLSDRIVVMNNGRIVQIGGPEEIYDRPANRFSAEFIGENNILRLRPNGKAGHWVIEELKQPFASPAATGPAPQALSIRPEKIARLKAGEANGPGRIAFDATIAEILFFGDVIKYSARLGDGALIKFKEHRAAATSVMRVDQSVTLAFAPGDAVLLADE
jgi:putative spermidine/putrescine transport system ATP-binding protein